MVQKEKIVLLLKLPPPITGATLMNSYVAESQLLTEHFNVRILKVSYKDSIEDVRFLSLKKFYILISTWFKLLSTLRLFKPKQVYFQISPVGIAFFRDCTYVFLIKIFRISIIYHLHGKGIKEYVSESRLKKAIYKWAFRDSSVICLSDLLISDISNIYKEKPYILANAIVNNDFYLNYDSKGEIVNIIFLSNIILSKGIIDFLEGLKLLVTQFQTDSFKAFIIGKEVDLNRTDLESEINLRSLNNKVEYIGAKYNDEKKEILNNSHILVHPTHNDVWGLVILEAMQAGLSVIATKEGAIPEIIEDGETGFLIDKNRPEQIADKLSFLIKNPETIKKMGIAGREKFLAKYTLDIFENNLLDVFNRIINRD